MNSHRVLVTGSAGMVGRAVCRGLIERGHYVRGFDRVETPGVAEHVVGDLTDGVRVAAAVEGMDTIVHLAAQANPRTDFLTDLLPNNIVATYHIFEAAKAQRVGRVIYASSMHVGHAPVAPGELIRPEPATRPSNYYGATKVFGEALCRMHAEQSGIEVIAVRIGFLPRGPEYVERLIQGGGEPSYLSPNDAGRFFACAVEATLPAVDGAGAGSRPFVILHATSRPPAGRQRYEIESARRIIGYEPRETWPQGMEVFGVKQASDTR